MKNALSNATQLTKILSHYQFVLTLILAILFSSYGFSQNNKEALKDSYLNYFNTERETIYLHFNKHRFLLNESIWFKGYIYDKKGGIPYITSSNIYVTLYEKSGKAIETKLYYAENGAFSGQFEVTKNLPSGYYFFKAHTNWMKNFVEDESFTSEAIEIINPNAQLESETEVLSTAYDLQFLPEGGHCISDVNNSIGLRVINCEGEGITVEGRIVNSKNEVVTTFKSNQFGNGKFELFMASDESYTAQYSINNQDFSTPLPISKPKGFTIAVNNYTINNLTYISLLTNKETLLSETGKTYYLAIHQNNKSSILNLDIDKLDTSHIVPIDNNSLPIGVNTITLFNNKLEPVLERLFFNYRKRDFISAHISAKSIQNDSVPIEINLKDDSRIPFSSNVSVSVLPAQTEALSTSRSIISAMLIDPYIQGELNHSDFYFGDLNRIKSFHLDVALMTQGWSKYEWKHIRKGPQDLIIPFDKGITIEGTVNQDLDPESNYEIQMFSMVNNINETKPLSESKNFNFSNYFIPDGTTVHFNILQDGKKITKPKLYARVINNYKGSLNQVFEVPKLCRNNPDPVESLNQLSSFDFEGQVLDTVKLSYQKNKWEPEPLKYSKSAIGNTYSRAVKITPDIERSYFNVTDLINANGFIVEELAGTGFVMIRSRNPMTFMSGSTPLLVIDDVNVGRSNYDILFGMPLNQIEEIYFNNSGLGYGAQGGAGVIRVYTRKDLGTLNYDPIATYANSLLIRNGFASQKEFYTPLFYSESNSLFNAYSPIDWKPELISDNLGNIKFSVQNTGVEKILVVVEGMSVNGKLISEIKEIALKSNINN